MALTIVTLLVVCIWVSKLKKAIMNLDKIISWCLGRKWRSDYCDFLENTHTKYHSHMKAYESGVSKKDAKKEEDTVDDDDLDVNIDDAEPSADQEVDLGGDDDLGVSKGKGDDEPDET
mgnify:CR=1 FL=1